MSSQVILGLAVLFGSLFIYMMAFRFPVFFSMILACATWGLVFPGRLPMSVIGSGIISGINSTTFVAICFYFFLGELLNSTELGDRLIAFLKSLVGHIPGSLSHINILASMIFAGVSGSSTADTASIGSMMIPMMKKEGYSAGYSAAVTEVSSIIGPIIPPSNGFIMCAMVLGVSVRKLFLGGIVPGILLGVFQLVISFILAKKRHFPCSEWGGWKNVWRQFKYGFGAVLLPALTIFFLLAGIGTVVEIGAVSCLIAIILLIAYGNFSFRKVLGCLARAAATGGRILAIICTSGIFTWIIASMGVTNVISAWASANIGSPFLLVCICMIIFFILGMLLETVVQHMVIMPMMATALISANVDLVWFSVLASLVINIGLNTPPVGNLIYASASIAECPASEVIKESLPYLAVMILLCILMLFCPGIVTWLPNLVG